jgi:hypothetical protein
MALSILVTPQLSSIAGASTPPFGTGLTLMRRGLAGEAPLFSNLEAGAMRVEG